MTEADFDKDVCKLFRSLTVTRLDHFLNMLHQSLLFWDNHIQEGAKIVFANLTDGHEFDNAIDSDLQIFIILATQLLEDKFDDGSIFNKYIFKDLGW